MCSAFNVHCHIYSSFPWTQYYCFKIVSIPWELNNIQFSIVICWGAWDGAVVRALTSHQCGPRSNMWVEFVAGSLVCSEGFFSGYSGFPLYSNLIRNQVDEEQLCGCANPKSLFIHFLFRNKLSIFSTTLCKIMNIFLVHAQSYLLKIKIFLFTTPRLQ